MGGVGGLSLVTVGDYFTSSSLITTTGGGATFLTGAALNFGGDGLGVGLGFGFSGSGLAFGVGGALGFVVGAGTASTTGA